MMEIVILSGKGGVGKSVITASLGRLFAEKYRVTLADTDVDAPNLHLTMEAALAVSDEVEASEKAFIDDDKCQGCLLCAETCRFSAIVGKEKPLVVYFACEGCGACALVCPEEAITIRKVANGRINIFHVDAMPVVAGELYICESSSGMLVDRVKEKARQEATLCRTELLLVDGPPGIGCPVIAASRGADYVVAVTEPTPAALADLSRAAQVVQHFNIPLGIVINRADIHPASKDAIVRYAAENGFAVLAEIPYDKMVSRAVCSGWPVVAAYPETAASRMLRNLAAVLEEKVIRPATVAIGLR